MSAEADCHPADAATDYCWAEHPSTCEDDIKEASDGGITGTSAYSDRFLFLDYNDSYVAARSMLSEAARVNEHGNSWLSEKTVEVTIMMLMYNGEYGVYSQVALMAEFGRGGLISKTRHVSSAAVPHWGTTKLAIAVVYLILLGYNFLRQVLQILAAVGR